MVSVGEDVMAYSWQQDPSRSQSRRYSARLTG